MIKIPGHDGAPSRDTYDSSRTIAHDALSRSVVGPDELGVLYDELGRRRTEDLGSLTVEEQVDKIRNRAYRVLPVDELKDRIDDSRQTGQALRVKYGIDPTGADVHLGHAVPLRLLSSFQRMGHTVTFIVGDFTAKIGDPSGRVDSRPVLTDEDVARNMSTYTKQVAPMFDVSTAETYQNGTWLSEYPLSRLMGVVAKVPVSQLLQRRDFRQRLEDGTGITQAELLYPVVMALDSVELETDVEVGGKDQFLNMQMCRSVMEISGMAPEVIVATDILEGTDGTGAKMSKSKGNYVGLAQSPTDIYGRLMSIPDELMGQYFSMLTELEPNEWQQLSGHMKQGTLNPMRVKEVLARDITRTVHGADLARQAQAQFTQKFSAKRYDTSATALPPANGANNSILDRIALARGESRKAIRRLVEGGGVKLIDADGVDTRITDIGELDSLQPTMTQVLKVGRSVYRISGE